MRAGLLKQTIPAILAAGLAVGLWFLFIVPYPSFRRTALVHNASASNIAIQCTTSDKKHELKVRLSPGANSEFAYFVGDRGAVTGDSVHAVIVVTNTDTGQRVKRNLQLPIGPSSPTIDISNDWFDLPAAEKVHP